MSCEQLLNAPIEGYDQYSATPRIGPGCIPGYMMDTGLNVSRATSRDNQELMKDNIITKNGTACGFDKIPVKVYCNHCSELYAEPFFRFALTLFICMVIALTSWR